MGEVSDALYLWRVRQILQQFRDEAEVGTTRPISLQADGLASERGDSLGQGSRRVLVQLGKSSRAILNPKPHGFLRVLYDFRGLCADLNFWCQDRLHHVDICSSPSLGHRNARKRHVLGLGAGIPTQSVRRQGIDHVCAAPGDCTEGRKVGGHLGGQGLSHGWCLGTAQAEIAVQDFGRAHPGGRVAARR